MKKLEGLVTETGDHELTEGSAHGSSTTVPCTTILHPVLRSQRTAESVTSPPLKSCILRRPRPIWQDARPSVSRKARGTTVWYLLESRKTFNSRLGESI